MDWTHPADTHSALMDLLPKQGGQAMNRAIKESYGFFQSPLNQTLVKTPARRDSRRLR
jgi:hypothetical protein